jgi:hypothetical protein
LFESQPTAAPNESQYAADAAPQPRRSRAIVLTRVDRRTALGKRIETLKAIYLSALGGAETLSPMKLLKVDDAAELKAAAELARGNYLRGGDVSLDDVVRAERKASAAQAALGIVERPAKPTTLDNIRRHYPAART